MSKNQRRLLQIIKENDRWFTAIEMAAIMEMHPRRIYLWMKSRYFKMLDCELIDNDDPAHKTVKAWRWPERNADPARTALRLARMFTGWYGQLYWTNDKEILHSVSKT